MINIEQLEHLVAFNKYKTLSKAAEKLHISQPVLTRSMQKLEQELEVKLFHRTKNRLYLNNNGILAVELAQRALTDINNMKFQIKMYDKAQHTITIGSCAPGPNIYITQKVTQFFPNKTVQSEIKNIDMLLEELKNNTYLLIITPYEISDELIESIPFMNEQLYFSLPYDHPLSNNPNLLFEDLDGEKMLLMSDVGFWHQIHKQTMPKSKFLIQQDRTVFYDLIELSSLPSFTSDFMLKIDGKPKNRKIIPINNKEAKATFYCNYLKKQLDLKPLLYHLVNEYQKPNKDAY